MRNFGNPSTGGLDITPPAQTRAAAGSSGVLSRRSYPGRPRFSFPIALTFAVLAFEAAVALSTFRFI